MKKEEFFELHLGKHLFPVKLVHEHRPNGRVSLATKEIIIRIPSSVPFEERKRIFEWAKDSIKQMYETKPEAFEKYIPVDYGKKSVITTYRDEIELKLKPQSAPPRFSAVLNENCLEITMPQDCPTNDPMLGDIVANILKKRYLPKVTLRLLNLNGEYFQVPMNKVKMRNNSTRWGSCSSGKNITISTRSLLLPAPVFEYILVHELCHLKEMNHSPAYWRLVASIDPDYKEKEQWLKAHGHRIKF